MDNDKLSNPLFRGLDILGNVFVLNVLYVIFSLPVITIGASTTALYYVSIRMVQQREGPVTKDFIRAFRNNFKQATGAWAAIIAAGTLLWAAYLYTNNFSGPSAALYLVVFAIEAVLLLLTLPFLFPLISCFKNTLWNTFKNSFLLAVSNLGSWLKIILAWSVPAALSIIYPVIFLNTWYLWLLVIFGFTAYGTSFTINKVFQRISDSQEKNNSQETAQNS